MDTLDWLFASQDSGECEILEDDIEIIYVSSDESCGIDNYQNQFLNIKSENKDDKTNADSRETNDSPQLTLHLEIENITANLIENDIYHQQYESATHHSPPLFNDEDNTECEMELQNNERIENNIKFIENDFYNQQYDESSINQSPPLFNDEDNTEYEMEIQNDERMENNRSELIENDCYNQQYEGSTNQSPPLFTDEDTEYAVEIQNIESTENNRSDINMLDTSLTKSGNERRRKKFCLKKSERVQYLKTKKRNDHKLKPPCASTCRKLCTIKISNTCRQKINDMFWAMNLSQQRNFLKNMTSKNKVSRSTVNTNKRQFTLKYSLHNDDDEIQNVCQTFFLATLGYNKNNNSILKRLQCDKNLPIVEKRGKYTRELAYKDTIRDHIESFNPTISHYRREHAPNKRYLPSDVNIKLMYDSFLEENQTMKCSYDTYRTVVKEQNISFTILGNEECEKCAEYNIVKHEHEKCEKQCSICRDYNLHKLRAIKSREAYDSCKNNPWDETEICVSVDLQKVIMLPRLNMYKQILFTKRIVAYNESFVPLGKLSKVKKPMAVIWHEATSGRKKEDIISAFYKFFLHYRDVKIIKLWLDNCAAQNKNWSLFSFFITIVNSSNINVEEIEIYYFEPGHTYMSADSFHHQVELSLKKQRKTYDFNDFKEAVKNANKGNTIVEVMTEQDVYSWTDHSSQARIKQTIPRPYLKEMVKVKFRRHSRNIFYSSAYDGNEYTELSFLKMAVEKSGLQLPERKGQSTGISAEHFNQIKKDILPLLPINRHAFWKNLPIKNVVENENV